MVPKDRENRNRVDQTRTRAVVLHRNEKGVPSGKPEAMGRTTSVLEYRKPFDELGAEIGKKASKDLEYFEPLCPFFNFNIYIMKHIHRYPTIS